MFKRIIKELRDHSPFTLFGAMIGILLMMVFKGIPREAAHEIFYVLHPLHIIMSAFVTTALYCQYKPKVKKNPRKLWKVLIIGYLGSVGIGTLSDSLIPFWGEVLMEMPHADPHIGFIERAWLINPIAIIAVILAYYRPMTKFPHAGHVLISTWASLFHMMMAIGKDYTVPYFGIFIFLFLAVWLPCCLSDIIFPLLFVKGKDQNKFKGCSCSH